MNEQGWRIVEMFYEDGMKEAEIADAELIPVEQVHAVLYAYESGDIHEEEP